MFKELSKKNSMLALLSILCVGVPAFALGEDRSSYPGDVTGKENEEEDEESPEVQAGVELGYTGSSFATVTGSAFSDRIVEMGHMVAPKFFVQASVPFKGIPPTTVTASLGPTFGLTSSAFAAKTVGLEFDVTVGIDPFPELPVAFGVRTSMNLQGLRIGTAEYSGRSWAFGPEVKVLIPWGAALVVVRASMSGVPSAIFYPQGGKSRVEHLFVLPPDVAAQILAEATTKHSMMWRQVLTGVVPNAPVDKALERAKNIVDTAVRNSLGANQPTTLEAVAALLPTDSNSMGAAGINPLKSAGTRVSTAAARAALVGTAFRLEVRKSQASVLAALASALAEPDALQRQLRFSEIYDNILLLSMETQAGGVGFDPIARSGPICAKLASRGVVNFGVALALPLGEEVGALTN